MSTIIAGAVRFPAENIERMRPQMAAMLAATRAEDGCEAYNYAEDVADPGLLRIFEIWRDPAAMAAHGQSPHMQVWRAACLEFGVSDRELFAYEIASAKRL